MIIRRALKFYRAIPWGILGKGSLFRGFTTYFRLIVKPCKDAENSHFMHVQIFSYPARVPRILDFFSSFAANVKISKLSKIFRF